MPGVFNAFKKQLQLSVRAKVLISVFLFVGILFSLLYVISRNLLIESYIKIENDAAIQNLDRADAAFAGEVEKYNLQLQDWSPWDDLYSYAENRDPEFKETTLFPEGVIHQNQSAFFLADKAGEIFFAIAMDLETETEISSSSLLTYFSNHRDLITHDSEEETSLGLVTMPEGIAVLTSKPILHNDGTGPIIASVSILRFVDKAMVDRINEKIHLNIELFPLNKPDLLPEDVVLASQKLLQSVTYFVTPKSEEAIYGYKLVYDAAGEPLLVLRTETPRPIYTQGKNTLAFFSTFGGLAMLVTILGLSVLLDRVVVRRITKLAFGVEQINSEKDISMKLDSSGGDEIAKLGTKINQMLLWLSSAQKNQEKAKNEVVKLLLKVEKGKEEAEQTVLERTEELSKEKARLLASINSLPFGFIITDAKGKLLLQNPSLLNILTSHQNISSVKDLSFTSSHHSIEQLLEKVRMSKKSEVIESLSYDAKFLKIVCSPILAEQTTRSRAAIIGFVLLVNDITEARNIERSKDEFFSIASHELRTPLTAIRWNTFMLLNDTAAKLKPEQKENVIKDVHGASVRLISIVNDFLEVSRLEQKKLTFNNAPFDLNTLVKEAVENLQAIVAQKKITLAYTDNLKEIVVAGDKDRTRQVLDNLIGNAIKYTKEGSITLSLEMHKTYAKVFISDTGIGISEQNQTRLFKKFQQAGEDMLAREDSQSTGLGLYIAKLVMSEMNGLIALEKSELGKGSTFSVTLPLANSVKV